MILDAISSFRDKWKLRQKHFEFLTNQSPRLALARTRHEREFSGAIQVGARNGDKIKSREIEEFCEKGVRKPGNK